MTESLEKKRVSLKKLKKLTRKGFIKIKKSRAFFFAPDLDL